MTKRRWSGVWLVGLVIGLAVFSVACGGGEANGDGDTSGGDTPTGQALLEGRCAQCHGLERVTSASKSVEEWQSTVARMIEKGAQLDGAEAETLVAYLADTYGP